MRPELQRQHRRLTLAHTIFDRKRKCPTFESNSSHANQEIYDRAMKMNSASCARCSVLGRRKIVTITEVVKSCSPFLHLCALSREMRMFVCALKIEFSAFLLETCLAHKRSARANIKRRCISHQHESLFGLSKLSKRKAQTRRHIATIEVNH